MCRVSFALRVENYRSVVQVEDNDAFIVRCWAAKLTLVIVVSIEFGFNDKNSLGLYYWYVRTTKELEFITWVSSGGVDYEDHTKQEFVRKMRAKTEKIAGDLSSAIARDHVSPEAFHSPSLTLNPLRAADSIERGCARVFR